jgi:cell wall-associated NlpC family hydrolase
MKAMFKVAAVSVGSLLLTACANTHYVTKSSAPAAPAAPAEASTGDVDGKYVAVVEHIAKQRGTRVVWVNPPKKDTH